MKKLITSLNSLDKLLIMFDNFLITSVFLKSIIGLILIGINLILKIKSYKCPVNFDTASHLYFAFLKKKKINFKSSYDFGIKYLLPRMYLLLRKSLSAFPEQFRIFNILASSLVIIIWVLMDQQLFLYELPYYFLAVLLINSLWVEYQGSATEFYEVILIMLMFLSTVWLSPMIIWLIQLFLLMVLIGGFKITNVFYLIPVILNSWQYIIENKLIGLFGVIVVLNYTFLGGRKSFFPAKNYAATRKWLHQKSINFLKGSPVFVTLLILLIGGNIFYSFYSDFLLLILQIIVFVIFISQRIYVGYLFYPVLVISFFIAFQLNWLIRIGFLYSLLILIFIFFYHTVRYILTKSARQIEIIGREKIFRQAGYAEYLKMRDAQVDWLKSNVKSDKVYLWGSNVALLLLANLEHIQKTFYNHNHLVYWSLLKDKIQYAKDVIRNNWPQFIIESATMPNFQFPYNEFKNQYFLYHSIGDMKVYKLK